MKLIYTGSVKNVYQDTNPENIWFGFTNDYSIFDWGKMPDPIPGKGEVLAKLGEWFFEKISQKDVWEESGLASHPQVAAALPIKHHFLEREEDKIKVLKLDIPKLEVFQIGGKEVYNYDYKKNPRQMIPLEVIFRFGVPEGSSLLKRTSWYNLDIFPGARFQEPLIEFSTKLESKDRMLTYQEAVQCTSAELVKTIYQKTLAVALLLRRLLAERDLELWDGKLEWGLYDGEVILADCIGPDEMRVAFRDMVFDKQFLRNYYLSSPWEKEVTQAQKKASQTGKIDWKKTISSSPEKLSPPYLEAAKALYEDFGAILLEEKKAENFYKLRQTLS